MLLPVSGSGPEDAVFVLNYWIYPHPIRGGVSSGVRQPGAGFPFSSRLPAEADRCIIGVFFRGDGLSGPAGC